MKPRANTVASLPDPTRFSLSWARHAGLVGQLDAQVEAKLRQRRRRRKRTTLAATVALALMALGAWGVPYVRDTGALVTEAAQRQTVALADGSRAELNARTRLHTDFRYGRRTVRLDQGEAFFSVAKDPAHPFLVETSAGTVRVTGTQFNVRLSADYRAEVTLLEGAVTVEPAVLSVPLSASSFKHLVPGQQLEFGAGMTTGRTLDSRALAAATSWRQGRLTLDSLLLGETAARLAAYHGVSIHVDPRIVALTPGGSYPLADLPGFLTALETVLPVRVVSRGPAAYAIVPR